VSRPEGRFRRLRASLAKSRRAIGEELSALVHGDLEGAGWERLEEALILADCGASTTAKVVGRLEDEVLAGELRRGAVRDRLVKLLAEIAAPGSHELALEARPAVVMVCGVNGTGKTTTVGKLAWHLARDRGLNVLVAAADTFRAAAVEQLAEWTQRAGAEIVRSETGGDPGAVAYDALAAAQARGADAVIVDTAGRLHTQADLMAELAKVRRVVAKQVEGAPHETLIVIDATTGQNGLRQARLFAEAAEVTGVVLTKLDGTAKGGIALAIADELAIPVKLLGTGESLEDLTPFDPREFAEALVGD
jgi:fused signal recognition particle receptor